MTHRRSPPSAFTLVEMVVATALAAVLLGALLLVTAGLARDRGKLAASSGDAALSRAIELLRWDLACARTASADGAGLKLSGNGALDPRDQRPTGRAVEVTYRVTPDGQLLRGQRALDAARDERVDLVAAGVSALEVEGISAEGVELAAGAAGRVRLRLASGAVQEGRWER